jgi:hypothetical protein
MKWMFTKDGTPWFAMVVFVAVVLWSMFTGEYDHNPASIPW